MEIDIDLIVAHGLTADEYILLQYLRNRYYGKIRSYFTNQEHLRTCLDNLEAYGFIELIQNGIKHFPQEYKIARLPMYSAKIINSMFDELLENYPRHVIRPNGIKEYLRTNTEKTRELYKKITQGSKEKHELILACLKYQLAVYARLGKMPYMRKLANWLANEEWEQFKDNILEGHTEDATETEIYGTQIV